jgi:hypothetical protein
MPQPDREGDAGCAEYQRRFQERDRQDHAEPDEGRRHPESRRVRAHDPSLPKKILYKRECGREPFGVGPARCGSGNPPRPSPAAVPGVPASQAPEPRDYRLLADMLLADIVAGANPVTVAQQAGRRWGRATIQPAGATPAAATRLPVRELDSVGFTPADGTHTRTA